MEQKLNTLAISNFKEAAKGSTVIILFSWILVIINIFVFIYACVSKDDFLRMLRKEQVDKNEANQFYTLVVIITVLSIIMMLLFLLLSYKSKSCFTKVNKELSTLSTTMQ
jgi:heme/copper-type cytochrome/quinol oxidase subunit 2